jgi:hypothetical protein
MDATSPDMKPILDAVAILHKGERERARALLLQLWEELSPKGEPLQISTMAHFLADTETDVVSELEWDLRALEAATGGDGAEDREVLGSELASFLPSLQLSVGDSYRRLGDLERARRHVGFAANRIAILPDDAYGKLIRGGLRRLQAALAAG